MAIENTEESKRLLKLRMEKREAEKKNEQAAAIIRVRCRTSTKDLLGAVYKSEKNHSSIILPPHQRLAADFMDAHRRSVHIWPVNHGKTGTGVGFALRKILENPSSRGAVVAATQAQAKKVLRVLRDYIDRDPDYQWLATNPEGIATVRRGDKWTDSDFSVYRPSGIKDPTVVAIGIDGGIAGARLDWCLVDDLLNAENTATKAQRDKVFTWLDSSVISRMEPDVGQLVIENSAWHPDDVLHRLERLGYATIRMSIDGSIYITDDAELKQKGQYWDSALIEGWAGGDSSFGDRQRLMPSVVQEYQMRVLVKTGAKPSGDNMLWDPHPTIPNIRSIELKHPIVRERKRLYYSTCRDDGSSMIKDVWIEACKAAARKRGFFKMPKALIPGLVLQVCGVDLAVSQRTEAADTVFFVMGVLESMHRIPLEIIIGKFGSDEISNIAIDVAQRYNAVMRVENNGAQQFMVDMIRQKNIAASVREHTTGKSKPYDIAALFSEIAQAAWLLPCGEDGVLEPELERFVQACLYYSPDVHTDDTLMAGMMAKVQATQFGAKVGLEWQGEDPGIGLSIDPRIR